VAVGVPSKKRVQTQSFERNEYDMESDEAKQVLTGKDIYFARCMFNSKGGDLAMRMYEFMGGESKRIFGFIQPPEGEEARRPLGRDVAQLCEDREIGSNLIFGSRHFKAMIPGDYMTVRLQATNPKGNIAFVEPVINIMPEDIAFDPNGKPIHTIVDGYRPGDLIHNLPIIGSAKRQDGPIEVVGLGYIARPEGESEFFYKPIVISGAEKDKGRQVSLVRIVKDEEDVTYAEKVE
jgi:hypothetical protein